MTRVRPSVRPSASRHLLDSPLETQIIPSRIMTVRRRQKALDPPPTPSRLHLFVDNGSAGGMRRWESVSVSLAALERDLELVQSRFFFFFVCVIGRRDRQQKWKRRKTEWHFECRRRRNKTREGGFFFSFNFNTRMVFNAAAWKDRKCLPETSGTNSKGERRWDRPSSTLLKAQEGRCYSHTSHHHLLKRESSSIFHQVKLHTLEKCWTANVLRFFFPQWY